jgi:hypothetical protein
MNNNLISPIIFDDELKAKHFADWHYCALCLCQVTVKAVDPNPRNWRTSKYIIQCPNCGDMYKHTIIGTRTMHREEWNRHDYAGELDQTEERKNRKPHTLEEIIKLLGF